MQGMRGGLPSRIDVAPRSAVMLKCGGFVGAATGFKDAKCPHQHKWWAPWDSNPQPAD